MSRSAKPAKARAFEDSVYGDGVDIDAGFTHRITSAAVAGVSKPAGAVASVFEAGTRAKPPKPTRRYSAPLRLQDVTIETGVPLPAPNIGKAHASGVSAVLSAMQPGQSVLLSLQQSRNMRAFGKKSGIPVAVRVVNDEQARVWRLQPGEPS